MKKLITLLAFALSAFAMNAQDTLYFTPTGWWLNDNAVFMLGLANTDDTVYYRLEAVTGAQNLYYAELSSTEYNTIRFTRCGPGAEVISEWETGWNRTSNMDFDYSEGKHWKMNEAKDVLLKTDFTISNELPEIVLTKLLYFTPTGWWCDANAYFKVGLMNTESEPTGDEYFLDSVAGEPGTYYAELPSIDYDSIWFFRYDPAYKDSTPEKVWNQTTNMAFDYSEGNHWVMKEAKDGLIKTDFIIVGYGDPIGEAITIRFKQTAENTWDTVYIFSWEPETFGGWPGATSVKDADGWYTIEVPAGGLTVGHVIFSDGHGTGDGGYQFNADIVTHKTACYELSATAATEVDCDVAAIEELSKIDNVKIYPNPVTSTLTIDLKNIKSVNVVNIAGKRVMNANNSNVINVSNLSVGIYFLEILQANGVVQYSKFIKK